MVGAPSSKEEPYVAPQVTTTIRKADPIPTMPTNGGASTGMKVLSFLFPIVGLILFLMDRDKKPTAAKDELKWAGIGFGVGLIGYLLLVGIGACSGTYY